MASHKKGGVVGKLASFFSMKVGLRYNRFAAGPGHREVKLQSSMRGIDETVCRHWRLLLWPLDVAALAFTGTSKPAMSTELMSLALSKIFIATCGENSFSSATVTKCTSLRSTTYAMPTRPGSTLNGCHPTRQTSIPLRQSGIIRSVRT